MWWKSPMLATFIRETLLNWSHLIDIWLWAFKRMELSLWRTVLLVGHDELVVFWCCQKWSNEYTYTINQVMVSHVLHCLANINIKYSSSNYIVSTIRIWANVAPEMLTQTVGSHLLTVILWVCVHLVRFPLTPQHLCI